MATDRLVDALLDGGVEFVIIGGVAAVLHGSTILTRDLDICVPLGSESVLRLQDALRPLHPTVRAGADRVPLELTANEAGRIRNLYVTTDVGRLDCLGHVSGVGDYSAVAAESIEFDLGSRRCRVLGIDALIRAKEATNREHDQLTVVQLKAIRERGSR